MTRFLLKRFTWGVFTLFIFISVIFFAVQMVLPYDFTAQFAMQLDVDELADLQRTLGLDQSLWTRYWDWLTGLLRLDFGRSFGGTPVIVILARAMVYSLLFLMIGTFLAFVIGQYLGKWMAWRRTGFGSNLITLISLAFYTTFPPWLAYIVTLITVPKLRGWLNIGLESVSQMLYVVGLTFGNISNDGVTDPLVVIGYMALSVLIGVGLLIVFNILTRRLNFRYLKPIQPYLGIGLALAGSIVFILLTGYGELSRRLLLITALPVFTYVLMTYSEVMMIMRTSMEDIMDEDFISVARAKGIPERIVRDKHAVRNAILPVIGRLVITIPYMLTGIVILEYTFGWPGVGTNLWNAIQSQNIPIILGFLFFIGLITLVARLILEILHVVLDPRQRIVQNPVRAYPGKTDRSEIFAAERTSIQPSKEHDRVLQIVERLINQERTGEAQSILVEYLKRDVSNARGWHLLSLTLTEEEQIVYALQQAIKFNPEDIRAKRRLADIQSDSSAPDEKSFRLFRSKNLASVSNSVSENFSRRFSETPVLHTSPFKRINNRLQLVYQRFTASWRIFSRSRLALLGLVILGLFVAMIIVKPVLDTWFWPSGVFDPITGYDAKINHPAPLSWKHLLGTTFRGKDVFSILLLATRNSFALGLTAGAIAAITGTILGVLAAYHRGLVDDGLSQTFDVFLLLPAPIFMAFAASSLRGLNPIQLGVVYGLIAGLGPTAILMRTHALSIASRPYIEAAKISGGRSGHIIVHHILPHMYPMALLQMLLAVTSAVIVDGFLSFLGITRYVVNWGTMLYESAIIVDMMGGPLPWNVYLAPLVSFSLFGMAFYLISRGMQRIANPRMRDRWS